MKTMLLALGLITAVPLAANAQIVLQAPAIPGVTVPGYAPPPPGYGGPPRYERDYWRSRQEDEWRRRAEYRDAEHRRWDWRRAHCVRDYSGQEFCRR